MKKPEEYLENAVNRLHDSEQPYLDENVYDGKLSPIIQAIKAAQEDAIRETVQKCVENATIECFEFKEDWMEEPINITIDDYGNIHGICKQSILSVADKLIKEL
jgi:hypothetical protein